MNKKTILLKNNSSCTPIVDFWRPYFERHFNVERMEQDKKFTDYDPRQYVFWGSSLENVVDWAEQVLDAGFSLIMDYLWDHFGYSHQADNILMLRCNNFIVPNEVLRYKQLGYESIEFVSKPNKFFLCLMHELRDHRDKIYDQIEKYKDISYISYVKRGIQIPGDTVEIKQNGVPDYNHVWQRFVNPNWYNKTNFSLVVETSVSDPRFYSEKILKPLAFKHPFIVWASFNILDRIKNLGFESFENIIDESYNFEAHNNKRLNMMLNEVERLHSEFQINKQLFTDKLTLEKIEHNYNLFYNQQLTDKIIQQEILDPVIEFVYG